MHPIHCQGGDGGKEATIFGCVSAKTGRWICDHLSTCSRKPHTPTSTCLLTRTCGTQGSSNEDIDVQSQRFIIKWCGASGGGGHGGTERQWLPIRFRPQALTQQGTQAKRG